MAAMSTLNDESSIERLKAYWEAMLAQELAELQQVEESQPDDDEERLRTIRGTFLEDIAKSLSNTSSERAISAFVEMFVEKLESGNEHYLDTTRTILRELDFERAIGPLLAAFGHATGVARFAVADALLDMGEAEPFFELLGSDDAVARSLAEGLIKAWGKAGPLVWPDKGLPAGTSAIIWHFEDDTLEGAPAARAALVEALLSLRQPHAADALYSLSHHEDEIVRTSARRALRSLGDARAAELISELSVDVLSYDVREVLHWLGEMGDPRAAERLISLVDKILDGSNEVSADGPGWESNQPLDFGDVQVENFLVDIVRALEQLGDARALHLLTRLLSHDSKDVRFATVWALGSVGGSLANEALATLMNDRASDVHDNASIALGLLGDTRALDNVIRLISNGGGKHLNFSKDPQARENALRSLAELGDPRAIDLLFTLYNSNSRLYSFEIDDVLFDLNAFQHESVRAALNSRVAVSTLISLLSEAETYRSITLPLVQAIGERGAYTQRLTLLEHVWNWRYAPSIASAERIAEDLRALRLKLPKSQVLSPYSLLLAATLASHGNHHHAAFEWAQEGLATASDKDIQLIVALSVLRAEALASLGDLNQAQRVLEEIDARLIQELIPSERSGGLALLEADVIMTKAFVWSKLGETREVILANYAADELLKTSLRLDWITPDLYEWLLGNRIAPIQHQALRVEGETYRQTATRHTDSHPRGPQEAYGRRLMLLGQIEEALAEGDHESYARVQQEVEKLALVSLTQLERIRFADQGRQAIFERLRSSEEEVSRLRAELNHLKKKKRTGKTAEKVKDRRKKLRTKQKDLHAFVRSLKERHGDIAAMWGKSPTDLAQLAERLTPKSGIVQFLVMERQSFAFVIRYDGSVEIESLHSEARDVGLQCGVETEGERDCLDLTKEVSRYRALLGGETISQVVRASRRKTKREEVGELLSQALLAPIEAHIEDLNQIILVPNAILHSLPFAALPWKEGYVVEHMELTLLPASSLMGAVLASPINSPKGLLALGNSIPNEPGWAALEGAEAEVAALSGYFPDLSPKLILTGEQAQREAVIEHDLSGYLLHFAVHAESGRKAKQARLLLTGGDLHYDDVIGLTIERAPLVVLSGCETGLGDRLSGDEVYSLANAFLLARAQAVLFSLWLLDDYATSVLMGEFYRHLSSDEFGTDATKALARAQRKLIREGFPPRFWAGFVLSEWTTHPS